MDCEKFDQHVIDALYEELDELTAAALKRHAEGCTRCAPILAGLRRAREVAALPLEEPSPDLEARILAAERVAVRRGPWYKKLVRGAAWAGSVAMRPQLAMAALFVLVVGSSLLLLRARPGTVGAPLQVTQRGEPGPTNDTEGQSKDTGLRYGGVEGERPAAGPRIGREEERSGDARKNEGVAGPAAAAPAEAMAMATSAPSASPPGGSASPAAGDAAGALADARATRSKDGCLTALPRYDDVTDKYPGSHEADEAKREAAACENEVNRPPTVATPPPPSPSPAKARPAAPPASSNPPF